MDVIRAMQAAGVNGACKITTYPVHRVKSAIVGQPVLQDPRRHLLVWLRRSPAPARKTASATVGIASATGVVQRVQGVMIARILLANRWRNVLHAI